METLLLILLSFPEFCCVLPLWGAGVLIGDLAAAYASAP
jgi:hypothetical protein